MTKIPPYELLVCTPTGFQLYLQDPSQYLDAGLIFSGVYRRWKWEKHEKQSHNLMSSLNHVYKQYKMITVKQ